MSLPTFTPQPMLDSKKEPNSTKYGFVVDHHAFWGLPIPYFSPDPAPSVPDSPEVKKLVLTVDAVLGSQTKWTNGQIRVFATRMPPLFHALHHNTLLGAPKQFIPREKRGTLPEAGENALVWLCSLNFTNDGTGSVEQRKPGQHESTIAITEFDKKDLIGKAKDWRYFDVERGHWDVSTVGTLGALWIVLLNEDGTPAWFDAHLGGGYRMWHYMIHDRNRNFFKWTFGQSADMKKNEVKIQIGTSPFGDTWRETIDLTLKLDWA
jgi:hypothetical protein